MSLRSMTWEDGQTEAGREQGEAGDVVVEHDQGRGTNGGGA
jgi:hypothetical protein